MGIGSVAIGLALRPLRFGSAVAVALRATPSSALRAGRLPADRAADRHSVDEHPADVRDRLAADQPTFVEEPLVVGVELLEGVVGQNRRLRLLGDTEHERVAASDRPGRRSDQFVVRDAGLELGDFLLVDAMPEGGIDDDRDGGVGVLLHEAHHRLVQLREAGQRAPFGGDVGAVDHHVGRPFS